MHTARGDGVAIIKRRHQDLHRDGVRDPATASGCGRLKEDLESSTWRWHQDFKATSSRRENTYHCTTTTMGDANPIRTLGDYSKPSHEGYKNTIEFPKGNNVMPLQSDNIRLVQNGCSFHRLRSEDPNQHLKDFLKLVDSLDLNAGFITTWEDLTTRFLAQFFPPERTAKLRNDILMFQQHQGESFSEAWTRFKDLFQKVPHHGIDLWLQNDPRDFAKPVKAISLPQDVPSTSDRRLFKLENQVQRLMEAHLTPVQPTQVNKITSLCEICSGPHDTQYCMENPEKPHSSNEFHSSLAEQNRNPSSPKRVHFVNSIIILNKENEAKEEGNVNSSTTGYKDHEITVENEEDFEEEIEEEEEDGSEHFDTFPTMKELRKFLIKNEEEIFTVCRDGVGIKLNGVASPGIVNPKVSLYISYLADFTLGVVVFVFDLQVIFDEKKLGSS
ncbi:MAK10-like protein [Tanacetum coccineum]